MVTALALYTGRALSEFELVGLTTNPSIIEQVLDILAKDDPPLIPTGKKPRRRGLIRLMPEAMPPEPVP
jgi:hypothetical protein